jgi:hypothetical protein
MTENKDKEIGELLKAAIPRVNTEPPRDLWPAMLNRMQASGNRFCWYDWALVAALCCWALAYPPGILQLLYQL